MNELPGAGGSLEMVEAVQVADRIGGKGCIALNAEAPRDKAVDLPISGKGAGMKTATK